MKPVYIALGANLSNPKETFIGALQNLESQGIKVIKASGLWQSPSWPPGQGHPDFLNAVAEVSYEGTAREFLTLLHAIESHFGRIRSEKNAPRPLDLDLLDFKGQIISDKNITTPHPRMTERGFVLFPLEEIAPGWTEPKSNLTVTHYLARLPLVDVDPMRYKGKFYN